MFEEDILCFRYSLLPFWMDTAKNCASVQREPSEPTSYASTHFFLNRSLYFLYFINFASSIFLSILCYIKKCSTAVKKPCQTRNKLYMYRFIYMLKKNKPVDLKADASLSQVRFSISSSIFTDCEENWVHAGTGVLINPH